MYHFIEQSTALLNNAENVWNEEEGFHIQHEDGENGLGKTFYRWGNPRSGLGTGCVEFGQIGKNHIDPKIYQVNSKYALRIHIHTDEETMTQAQIIFEKKGIAAYFGSLLSVDSNDRRLLVHIAPELYPNGIKIVRDRLTPTQEELFGLVFQDMISSLTKAQPKS